MNLQEKLNQIKTEMIQEGYTPDQAQKELNAMVGIVGYYLGQITSEDLQKS